MKKSTKALIKGLQRYHNRQFLNGPNTMKRGAPGGFRGSVASMLKQTRKNASRKAVSKYMKKN
jgi:hypothetical protein